MRSASLNESTTAAFTDSAYAAFPLRSSREARNRFAIASIVDPSDCDGVGCVRASDFKRRSQLAGKIRILPRVDDSLSKATSSGENA